MKTTTAQLINKVAEQMETFARLHFVSLGVEATQGDLDRKAVAVAREKIPGDKLKAVLAALKARRAAALARFYVAGPGQRAIDLAPAGEVRYA